MTAQIYLSKAEITEVEEKFVLEALRSGWIAHELSSETIQL